MNIVSKLMEKLALSCSAFAGTSPAFVIALTLVVAWAVSGPFFHYSPVWQMVINTFTTIVTFLMVFLIQRAQNKDMISIHAKLNELIAAQEGASNMLVNIEDATESELIQLKQRFVELSGPEDATTHAKSVASLLQAELELEAAES
ncbi:hypothetical protein BH10CYA1_BH10CYA1_40220 [soil metagenome]